MPSGAPPPQRGVPRPLSGGPSRFGPFWLEARLAVGGTAEVYVARPVDPDAEPKKLIVKRLLPHFVADPDGRTMFDREAALHAAVRSENVVKVLGAGVEGDEPWLAIELVDGCDLYRLLRRLVTDGRKLAPGIAVHVAREVLLALNDVHSANDANGQPLGIIHRDVTPSNVYLSASGQVKLGDFGIARSATRATMRSGSAAMLKGKFAYLSPEQIAGEPFDHRSDLFAVAVVLSEMLLGQPLFSGSGQLAILLAIRDCRIDPLRNAQETLPAGLYDVLVRALSRDPGARYATASALSAELARFGPAGPRALAQAQAELGALVLWVQSVPSSGTLQAAKAFSGVRAYQPAAVEQADDWANSERLTKEYVATPSFVITQRGESRGPWTFARLVEALATGEIVRGDTVDYQGRGLAPVEAIEDLARFLPPPTATTNRMTGVGAPDFADNVSAAALTTVLLRIVETDGTGVLFAEGPGDSRRSQHSDGLPGTDRKELYFVGGKLHHVTSSNASELIGEFLIRRGTITRDELNFALAVLPRHEGKIGETLVTLGLVPSALEMFRAIRDQGCERVLDLFQWPAGQLQFYAGQTARQVEFPLDLDVLPLLVAGLEATEEDASLDALRARAHAVLGPSSTPRPRLSTATWPPSIRRLLEATSRPRPVGQLLVAARAEGKEREVLRDIELLLAAQLVEWE